MTPTDPVEAFFGGIRSVFGRTLAAALAIFAGYVLCTVGSSWGAKTSLDIVAVWALVAVWMIFEWVEQGVLFFIGFAALVTMFVCFGAFLYHYKTKTTFFALFTAATIYFSPLTFSYHNWVLPLCIYLGIGLCYWGIPYLLERRSH